LPGEVSQRLPGSAGAANRAVECMAILALLVKISRRWDTPSTPGNHRYAFGTLLVSWLIGAVGLMIAVVRWELMLLVLTGMATGRVIGRIQQRRHLPEHPADPRGCARISRRTVTPTLGTPSGLALQFQ
jgi:hypothetical protein